MLCVLRAQRGNAQAQTMVVDFTTLVEECDAADVARLRTHPLSFFDRQFGGTLEPTLIVKGPEESPLVELRPIERFEPRGDEQTIEAFERVYDVAQRVHERVCLSAGELLIVNNKRCSHARSPYTPKSEAVVDRWLQNVYASRSSALWENEAQSHVSWPARFVP